MQYLDNLKINILSNLLDDWRVNRRVVDRIIDLVKGRLDDELPKPKTVSRQAAARYLDVAVQSVDRYARQGKLVRNGRAFTFESVVALKTKLGA